MLDSLREPFDHAVELFAAKRKGDFLQPVESADDKPQIGMHHRMNVGVGIVLQQVSQQPASTVMLVELAKAMSHAAMGIEQQAFRWRHAPLLELPASLHEELEDRQRAGRVALTEKFGGAVEQQLEERWLAQEGLNLHELCDLRRTAFPTERFHNVSNRSH